MSDLRGKPFTVNFRVHELRTGSEAGARDEFEQMIAQLVDALHPGARRISPNPGDGGIDVFLGRLDDRVVIWQVKYFLPKVVSAHRPQIKESFASALSNARKHDYRIDRWILCVPSSMDYRTALWWDRWQRAQEAETASVKVALWDENQLLGRLGRPEAAGVRATYYAWPGTTAEPVAADERPTELFPPEAVPPVPARHSAFDQSLHGGETVRLASQNCLLHGDPKELRSGDGAWLTRQGTVSIIGPPPRAAWFRQVVIRLPGGEADALAASVDAQARLLTAIGGRDGVPRLIECRVTSAEAVLLSARPSGRTWREVFGPADPTTRSRPLDRTTASELLVAAARLGDALTALHKAGPLHDVGPLHETGYSHRALTPDGVILPGPNATPELRDVGLAAVPRRPGEGPEEYRAPEQERLGLLGLDGPEVGFRTDVYRLAAMTYHCLTGYPPARSAPVPLRAFGFDVPDASDEVLRSALDPDPRRRPANPRVLADSLRASAEHLARTRF